MRFIEHVAVTTLNWTDALERIVAAREPQKLPVVLSVDEIVRFLEAVHRVAQPSGTDDGLRGGPARRQGRAPNAWRQDQVKDPGTFNQITRSQPSRIR